MTTILELRRVALSLPTRDGDRAILKDVSFGVREGEALGLVGESGSGKSMTLRTILGTVPSGGSVKGSLSFGGTSLTGPGTEELRRLRGTQIGVIGQDPRASLNPVRTIESFLTEGLVDVLGEPRRKARDSAESMLGMVGLHDPAGVLRSYPHELSGGMLQRVCIAAALTTRPCLLLADEPTTALDVTTQSEVMAIIDDLRREQGMAMLFVTHDLELAAGVCDRIAVMYAGEIVEIGTPEQLHTAPRHPYTRLLMDARPTIDAAAERLAVVPGRPAAAHESVEGCAFAPRCPWAEDQCRHDAIPLAVDATGAVRCRRSAAIASQLVDPEVVTPRD
jgi:oligopeptide/dipeptide ABC transporter ATP-binding protein